MNGGSITAIKASGSTEEISFTDSMVSVSGYDSHMPGSQVLTVTYDEKSVSYIVTVSDLVVTFDPQNGSPVTNKTIVYNTKIPTPDNPAWTAAESPAGRLLGAFAAQVH